MIFCLHSSVLHCQECKRTNSYVEVWAVFQNKEKPLPIISHIFQEHFVEFDNLEGSCQDHMYFFSCFQFIIF